MIDDYLSDQYRGVEGIDYLLDLCYGVDRFDNYLLDPCGGVEGTDDCLLDPCGDL